MKKILLAMIFCLSIDVYGQQQTLHLYTSLNFNIETVIDNQDIYRYSISKLFDNDDNTCMAVKPRELKNNNDTFFSFSIRYPEETYENMIGFRIKPGFFDERYYASNSRIKTAEVYIKTHYKSSNGYNHYNEETYEYSFDDKMEEQNIEFPTSLQGRVIEFVFKVKEIYEGNKWDDICVSGIEFLHDEHTFETILSARPYTSIDWYCIEEQPYIGMYRSDHASGLMYLKYIDSKISSILVFSNNMYEDRAPTHRYTYTYEYTDSEIVVTEYDHASKTKNNIRNYIFENNKIISEVYIDGNDKEHKINYKELNSSDNLRDYISGINYSSRLILNNENLFDTQYFYSETNIYDVSLNKLKRTLRSDYWKYLVPVEFIILN